MLHGDLSGVASEHTKIFSFLLLCNIQISCCDGFLTGSLTSTEICKVACDSKNGKEKTTTTTNKTLCQRTELFHDGNCPVKWQLDLETIERKHQREYDIAAYLPCVWLFNHGQLSDGGGLASDVFGSQRGPPHSLRVPNGFILPCLPWPCSINSIIFQEAMMS